MSAYFLYSGNAIKPDQLLFADHSFENPAMALEETAVDHDALLRPFDPLCHRRMRHEKRFSVTGAGKRRLVLEIGC